jgi:hypothetical protein
MLSLSISIALIWLGGYLIGYFAGIEAQKRKDDDN